MGILSIFKRFTVVKREDFEKGKKALDDINYLSTSNNSRPYLGYSITDNQRRYGLARQGTYLTPIDLYEMALYSDIIRLVHHKLAGEMFRNGIDIEPLHDTASPRQLRKIERFLRCANDNGQSFLEVLREFEDDLNTLDDAYLLVVKDYGISDDNRIVGSRVKEIIRINPINVLLCLDMQERLGYDENGNAIYFKLGDRENVCHEKIDPVTGLPNLRAHYKIRTAEGGDMYYNKNEICHCSKYKPSKTYGFSPLFALYNKVSTLLNQDNYIRKYYGSEKPVKSLLFVNTKNTNSLIAAFNKLRDMISRNPHQIYPLCVDTEQGRQPAQFINFMNNLQEMQYTEVRNEMRQVIGAIFGVSAVFMNDVSTSGGLNNEGLQITVTNRAVELGQHIYNHKVIPFVLRQMGISDYEVILVPSEERDEVAELDKRAKEIANAKAMLEVGIEVSMDKEGNFIYSEGELSLPEPGNPFGGFGGEEESDAEGTVAEFGEPDTPELISRSVNKEKVPLAPGEKPPEGKDVKIGPRGGRYYETGSSDDSSDDEKPVQVDGDTNLQIGDKTIRAKDLPGYTTEGMLENGEYQTTAKESVSKLQSFIEKAEIGIGTIALASFALNPEVLATTAVVGGVAWLLGSQNNKVMLTIPSKDDEIKLDSYKDFVSESVSDPKFKEVAANLNKNDWVDVGVEQVVAQRFIDTRLSEVAIDNEKYDGYKNEVKKNMTWLSGVDPIDFDNKLFRDMMIEDARIILSEEETKSNGQYILNAYTAEYDAKHLDEASKRRKLLSSILEGNKNE